MAGLYIHIPFCRSKCFYCDFYSLPRYSEFHNRYVAALCSEWEMRRSEVPAIKTIYFGGGTPSVLSKDDLMSLSDWLPVSQDTEEFTIEVNPEDVTCEHIQLWKSIGVNRVSMGIQSLNNHELKAVGRRHTASNALDAVSLLQPEIGNISLDFIIGLPGQNVQSLQETIRHILHVKPQHLSVYILSYEQGTRLWAMRKAGKINETSDSVIEEMYFTVCDLLADAGYIHYEISNFALPGFEARHNSSYWAGVPYLGLGAAAHSFDGIIRRFNPSYIRDWLKDIEKGQNAYIMEEESIENRINDMIMTGLRTRTGISINKIPDSHRSIFITNLRLLPEERVIVDGDNIYIPERKWLLSDDTIARLFV